MKRITAATFIAAMTLLGLTGCKSNPACLFADDYIGCLVITDNQTGDDQ